MPNQMLVDQSSSFGNSDAFISIAARSSEKVDRTGIEARNSLILRELYQQLFRNTFRKLRIDHSSAPKVLLLLLSIKSMITLQLEGLVPSALVFSECTPEYTRTEPKTIRLSIYERTVIASSAGREIRKKMGALRISLALRPAAKTYADNSYEPAVKFLI